VRIDFFRGRALYMIIFDHIPGDPLSKFTYPRFGFSDAAEIVVFLSGVSCGIVYSRVFWRQGVGGLLIGVSWRALQIYTYYLIASIVTILLIFVSRDVVAIPDNHQASSRCAKIRWLQFSRTIFLISPPDLPDFGSLSPTDVFLHPHVHPHCRMEHAPNIPHRNLYLSPGHALYVDGVLMAVKGLVNE
jgi:OpgC protein